MQEVANTQTYIHNKLVADVTALETALIGKWSIFYYYFVVTVSNCVFAGMSSNQCLSDKWRIMIFLFACKTVILPFSFCRFSFLIHIAKLKADPYDGADHGASGANSAVITQLTTFVHASGDYLLKEWQGLLPRLIST